MMLATHASLVSAMRTIRFEHVTVQAMFCSPTCGANECCVYPRKNLIISMRDFNTIRTQQSGTRDPNP